MFRPARLSAANTEPLEKIEGWVRSRFKLLPRDLVLVNEIRPRLPGFPALQTTVLFWRGSERYRFVHFFPAAMVVEEDLPLAWLLPSLIDDGADCC
jgi:hypothetical protein